MPTGRSSTGLTAPPRSSSSAPTRRTGSAPSIASPRRFITKPRAKALTGSGRSLRWSSTVFTTPAIHRPSAEWCTREPSGRPAANSRSFATARCSGPRCRRVDPIAQDRRGRAGRARCSRAVGHATHYHADYVLPYWADVLDKSVQIGRHIFYRLRGPVGDARGFSQRYGGAEPELPKPDAAVTLPATTATAALAATLASDAVTAAAPSVQKAAAPTSQLAIDDERTGLLIDGGAAPANKPHKTKRRRGCPAPDGSVLTPLRANDMRASSNSTC